MSERKLPNVQVLPSSIIRPSCILLRNPGSVCSLITRTIQTGPLIESVAVKRSFRSRCEVHCGQSTQARTIAVPLAGLKEDIEYSSNPSKQEMHTHDLLCHENQSKQICMQNPRVYLTQLRWQPHISRKCTITSRPHACMTFRGCFCCHAPFLHSMHRFMD